MNRIKLATITSLWILIPMILMICIIAIGIKKYQNDSRVKRHLPVRIIISVLLGIYLMIYIYLTFAYRRPTKTPNLNLELLWSYREAFQLIPLKIIKRTLARQIVLNILLTVPPGLLLPILLTKAKHPYCLTVIIICIMSIMTEILQYFTCLGLCEMDDVLNNLIGCFFGIGVTYTCDKLTKPKYHPL